MTESMEKAAIALLMRAVTLDKEGRFTESFSCYTEGTHLLMEAIKGMTDKTKSDGFRAKANTYLTRAEQIKAHIAAEKQKGLYTEHFEIHENATGFSYNTILGRFLGVDVVWVHIEDPYIRKHHQCVNLLRLCELFVAKCVQLKEIRLVTSSSDEEQAKKLSDISKSLKGRGISLDVKYSSTLHDRQIRMSSGWVVKIGRGLDYFKAPEGQMSLGYFDLDLRPCMHTSVDIFFNKQQ
ncbi:MIT domain-containing protein 1-like [Neocloeon triangulifer]|uniref:MIT domain-containing protein 1-like n=1 Tax=Neocloeon triangulifer TaxID=2078957 RepID=UPI00286F446A|nr:MIT domain-containing protein 1-like [Neocloeon triangulifer]XP_059486001.1 MIT domain-containing protein 1-like [Neocloeon triangulifer]